MKMKMKMTTRKMEANNLHNQISQQTEFGLPLIWIAAVFLRKKQTESGNLFLSHCSTWAWARVN